MKVFGAGEVSLTLQRLRIVKEKNILGHFFPWILCEGIWSRRGFINLILPRKRHWDTGL